MNTDSNNQPLTHWAQLLFIFLIPGALQGLAFYLVADSTSASLLSWRAFVLWFLVIAPTCVFLITAPQDRWRSVGVAVVLALMLSALFYFDARDSLLPDQELSGLGTTLVVAMICTLVIIYTALPFYRTRWQRGLSFRHYASLFEYAWNQTICVLVGLLFTALFAALMGLTAGLFSTVGISLDEWLFDTPLMGAWVGGAFATAVGVARQSDAVILGSRELLLALLRILLLVMLPICIVFIGLVAVIGVDHVDTGLSIAFLMVAASVMAITLTSARVGDAEEELSGFQQLMTRGMAAVILPLALLAVHALWFRVVQHGWTGHRAIGAVVILLCLLYGMGYLLAAFHKPQLWVPRVNRWMALMCALMALLLMTPLLDPDRIGVRDQIARFNDGRTPADKLDLAYLKFVSGKAGTEALQALASSPEAAKTPLKENLERLATFNNRYDYEYEQGSPEMRNPLIAAVSDGTFRLFEERKTGWLRLTTPDQIPDSILGSLALWANYETSEYCVREAYDCAFLASSTQADLLAIRLSSTEMMFYVLPSGDVDVRLPDIPVNVEDILPETPNEDELPQVPPPYFPPQPTQTSYSFTETDIDDWFAILDQGRVPTEIVQVPSILIGPVRVLQSGPVLAQ